MEIGPRYDVSHDIGGGGWERDGYLSWKRMINGKEYVFDVTWDPDYRTPGGMKYMWGYRIHGYTMEGSWVDDKGYTHPQNYHGFKWEGHPTGATDKSIPVKRLRIPKRWYYGIIDKAQLQKELDKIDEARAAFEKKAEALRKVMEGEFGE